MPDNQLNPVIPPESLAALKSAIARSPRELPAHLAYARALRSAGKLEEAARACHAAIRVRPDSADAVAELAEILVSQGKPDPALKAWTDAVRLDPARPRWWRMLARERARSNKWPEALQAFNKAVQLEPGEPEAWLDLGQAYEALKQWSEAQRIYEEGVRRFGGGAPGSELARRLAGTFGSQKQFAEARKWVRQSLEWDPKNPAAWRNLGMASLELGELEEAEQAYARAVELDPESASRWCEWGRSLKYVGKLPESLTAYNRAVALAPTWLDAQADRSMTLLLKGDWKEGFAAYEIRIESTTFPGGKRTFPQPQWHGEKLPAKTLLLYGEQGMGDTLQFLRFVRPAANRAAAKECIVEVQEESLRRLAQSVDGVSQVILRGEKWPADATRCSLMSLPHILGTTLESVPNTVPYLHLDEPTRTKWQQLVGPPDGRLRVGVAWSGSTSHPEDAWRSIPAQIFWQLARLPNITWFNLQKGIRPADVPHLPKDLRATDLMQQHPGFLEAAGLISQLDLVIAVDTAAVHLAGALAKPVWTLLSRRTDWRWMMEREDTPWYPTMRLFRQSPTAAWPEIVARVAAELQKMTTPPITSETRP